MLEEAPKEQMSSRVVILKTLNMILFNFFDEIKKFEKLFKGNQGTSLQELMENKKTEDLETLAEPFVANMALVKHHLKPKQDADEAIVPLGQFGIELAQLVLYMVKTNNEDVKKVVVQSEIVNVLLEAVRVHNWNNILQVTVRDICLHCLGLEGDKAFLQAFLESSKLGAELLEMWKHRYLYYLDEAKMRNGYMGIVV